MPLRHCFVVSAIALSALASLPNTAFAGCKHTKCSSELHDSAEGPAKVIIQYTADTDSADEANIVAAGRFKGHLHSVHSISAEIPVSALEQLAQDEKIARISINHKVIAHGGPKDSSNGLASISTSPEFTAEPINAPQVWALGFSGAGIGVAVIDSGINPVADLGGNKKNSPIVYSQASWRMSLMSLQTLLATGPMWPV